MDTQRIVGGFPGASGLPGADQPQFQKSSHSSFQNTGHSSLGSTNHRSSDANSTGGGFGGGDTSSKNPQDPAGTHEDDDLNRSLEDFHLNEDGVPKTYKDGAEEVFTEKNRDLPAEMAALGRTAERLAAEQYMTAEQSAEYQRRKNLSLKDLCAEDAGGTSAAPKYYSNDLERDFVFTQEKELAPWRERSGYFDEGDGLGRTVLSGEQTMIRVCRIFSCLCR